MARDALVVGAAVGPPPQQGSLFGSAGSAFDPREEKLASKQQQKIPDNYRYNSTKLLGKNNGNQFVGQVILVS